jgi:tetratricopeptide (TPR) repeat protein
VTEAPKSEEELLSAAVTDGAARTSIPITTRLGIEIPKPKDWQAFQRNCVLLFRAELGDPNAQEYGRGGQKQRGIDVLGRRGGRGDHFVGIQCRLIQRPLKEDKILSDAREALEIKAGLKELIFATTAPDDVGAHDSAIAVTQKLRDEGHDLTVVVYGWGQLQTLIAPHEIAYNAFHPSAVANSAPQAVSPFDREVDLAARIAAQVAEQLRAAPVVVATDASVGNSDEDPALHARIDIFRDLFRNRGETLLAERGLLDLLSSEDLTSKPWAKYRIETNLASIAIDLGREAEAAERFEAALSAMPDNGDARSNLALARMMQGRYDEAMTLAREALALDPQPASAISYLLQAASRSDWEGDPETLIPDDLRGSVAADLGLAEFLRRRDTPGWAARSLELSRAHDDVEEFARIRAISTLALALDSGETVPGGVGPVSDAELNRAADDLKALVEHNLAIGFDDAHDNAVHLNNAAVLLRLCERHEESEALLVKGMPTARDEPNLRRLLALARMELDRFEEGAAAIANDPDPENQILYADLLSLAGDSAAGLAAALAIDPAPLEPRLQRLRWRTIGETALRVRDAGALKRAVAGLRESDPGDIGASLMELRGLRMDGGNIEAIEDRLRALAASAPADMDMTSRFLLANELFGQDLADEASRLLEGHVDMGRASPAATLYLRSLAGARRDEAFREAIAAITSGLDAEPGILWTIAAHAWNLGDLEGSLRAIENLLAVEPDNAQARLLRIEIFIRQDKSGKIFEELEKPVEALDWRRPSDQFRLAALLGHFGFAERAADLAYRMFVEHRDLARAWTTLSILVLDEGRGPEDRPQLWGADRIAENSAVNLAYADGGEVFFIVEPDPGLRRLDPDSWEPDHPLAVAVAGLRKGDPFVGPDGRDGVVGEVRHKYVARLHYSLEHFEKRFPGVQGFKSIQVNDESPDGFEELRDQLRARKEWIAEEESQYVNGPMPIAGLAFRVGMDAIEAAAGLASNGVALKTAMGRTDERQAAADLIDANTRKGCVFDLLTFWTAWRIGALDTVREVCGPIAVPQSLLDRMRARRERLQFFARDGFHSAGIGDDGRILVTEASADAVRASVADTEQAIGWLEEHAEVLPLVAGEQLRAELRHNLQLGKGDLFDALIIARQTGRLHVSDDLPMREFDRASGGSGGVWLHSVFDYAVRMKTLEQDQYIRWTAALVEYGQNYLGVSGQVLARAARLDSQEGQAPGRLFRILCKMIGGAIADPISHMQAVLGCIGELWDDRETTSYREAATGHLLEQLIRGRSDDFAPMLANLIGAGRSITGFPGYAHRWLKGHFLYEKLAPKPGRRSR